MIRRLQIEISQQGTLFIARTTEPNGHESLAVHQSYSDALHAAEAMGRFWDSQIKNSGQRADDKL